jgi:hypothetical protein
MKKSNKYKKGGDQVVAVSSPIGVFSDRSQQKDITIKKSKNFSTFEMFYHSNNDENSDKNYIICILNLLINKLNDNIDYDLKKKIEKEIKNETLDENICISLQNYEKYINNISKNNINYLTMNKILDDYLNF